MPRSLSSVLIASPRTFFGALVEDIYRKVEIKKSHAAQAMPHSDKITAISP